MDGAALGLPGSGGGQVDVLLLPLFSGHTALKGLGNLQLHGIRADARRFRRPGAVDFPLNRPGKTADKIRGLGYKPDPFLIHGEIILFLNGPELILHPVGGFLQKEPELVRSELPQVFVRVLGIPHLQNLHLKPCLFQHGNGPLGGILARVVPVVDEHNLLRIPAQQRRVLLRQGGAQGGHRTVKAVLVQGNGIHIPLHQNQVAQLGFLGNIQGEQVFALVENDGFRGI